MVAINTLRVEVDTLGTSGVLGTNDRVFFDCGTRQWQLDNIDQNEVCDDGNTQNGDSCNPTCNLGNSTSLFAGSPGNPGLIDGIGQNARFGGVGNLAIRNRRDALAGAGPRFAGGEGLDRAPAAGW